MWPAALGRQDAVLACHMAHACGTRPDVARALVTPPSCAPLSRRGQRKRVTTAEVLCGPCAAILMDEISTGLDSATTYSVVKSFWHIAHAMKRTMVISLLQPPPEVVQLFDGAAGWPGGGWGF